jgi:hypothetical protein
MDGETMISKQTNTVDRTATATDQPIPTEPIEPEGYPPTAEARWQRTAIAAFYRAETRGFAPGRELEDWLAAEREVHSADAAVGQPGQSLDALVTLSVVDAKGSATAQRKRPGPKGKSARGETIQARNRGNES